MSTKQSPNSSVQKRKTESQASDAANKKSKHSDILDRGEKKSPNARDADAQRVGASEPNKAQTADALKISDASQTADTERAGKADKSKEPVKLSGADHGSSETRVRFLGLDLDLLRSQFKQVPDIAVACAALEKQARDESAKLYLTWNDLQRVIVTQFGSLSSCPANHIKYVPPWYTLSENDKAACSLYGNLDSRSPSDWKEYVFVEWFRVRLAQWKEQGFCENLRFSRYGAGPYIYQGPVICINYFT